MDRLWSVGRAGQGEMLVEESFIGKVKIRERADKLGEKKV